VKTSYEVERLGPTRTAIRALADEIQEIDENLPDVEKRLIRARAACDRAANRRWDVERERNTLNAQKEAAQEAIETLRKTLPEGAVDGLGE
jgi:chromosome segregation ATPase